jgi:Caspase domain
MPRRGEPIDYPELACFDGLARVSCDRRRVAMLKRLALFCSLSLLLCTTAPGQGFAGVFRKNLDPSARPFALVSSPFVVDGLTLGVPVPSGSQALQLYQCSPSNQFNDVTWCKKQETAADRRGDVTLSSTIARKPDGTAVYLNRYIEPAFLGATEVRNEIDRLSTKFGERGRELWLPQREGQPSAVIAVWGTIRLEQLDTNDTATVAAGGSPRKGILVSFLGDLSRSAKAGAPVYRITGGEGFLWTAAFNGDGRGVLRFLAIDPSKLITAQPGQPLLSTNVPSPLSSPTTAPPQPSLWDHNGSIVRLEAKGASRKFIYEVPRQGMLDAGVRQGTLLFEGVNNGGTSYSGTAYIFPPNCRATPYLVDGPIVNDGQTVVLKGQRPVVDPQTCRPVGSAEDTLTFNYRAPISEPLVAVNRDNSQKGGPFAPIPSSPPSPRASENRIALVIGNSRYKNAPYLANPTKDADLVAKRLEALGFQVRSGFDLDLDALLSALRRFANEANDADWAVIYFAGHGVQIDGVNYLIPTDAILSNDRDAPLQAVDLHTLLNAVDRARRMHLVILDACRDNPFSMTRSATRSIGRGGLAEVEPEAGTMVVFSAKDGHVAYDGTGPNSPFVTALAARLVTPNLEIRRMFDLVRDDVMSATDRRQQPFTYHSLSGSQDYFFTQK